MMTVITAVLKDLLIDVLSRKKLEAHAADTKPSYFITRNRELSEKKQALLGALITTISTAPQQDSDLTFLADLRKHIETCKNQSTYACEENKYSPQATEQILDELIKFIDMFTSKAPALNFLNIPNDTNAFTKFTQVVISYHARRSLDNARSGMVDVLFKNPAISSANAFLQEVDRLVNGAFSFAMDTIGGFNQDGREYLRRKSAVGVLCLQHIELQYRQVLTKYPVVSKVVSSYLDELLGHADKVIIADNQGHLSAEKHPAGTRSREGSEADDDTIYDGSDPALR